MPKITSWNVNGLKSLCVTYGNLDKALDRLQSDIICLQETKLASASALRSDVCISADYFSYFSICGHSNRHEKAYSGTATFVRKSLPVLKAQEGLTGRHNTAKQDNQGGDDKIVEVLPSEVRLTEEELRLLDSEGRCVITDHGDFILLNIYAPNAYSSKSIATTVTASGDEAQKLALKPQWEVSFETDITDITDRFVFKMKFNYLLSFCINKLQSQGKRVVVVGDLNVTSTRLDHCESGNHDYCEPFDHRSGVVPSDEKTINTSNGDYWRYTFESRPQVLWMKNVLSPHPCYISETNSPEKYSTSNYCTYHANPLLTLFSEYIYTAANLVDTFRHFWPTREHAYTWWNTLTGARKTNFGTRLDYILVSHTLLEHVVSADIEPVVLGSDHCPIHCVIRNSDTHCDSACPPPSLCSIYTHSSVQTSLTHFLRTNKYNSNSNITCPSPCADNNDNRGSGGAERQKTPPVHRQTISIEATSTSSKRGSFRSSKKTDVNPMSVAIMESLFRKAPPHPLSPGYKNKRKTTDSVQKCNIGSITTVIMKAATQVGNYDNYDNFDAITNNGSDTANVKRYKACSDLDFSPSLSSSSSSSSFSSSSPALSIAEATPAGYIDDGIALTSTNPTPTPNLTHISTTTATTTSTALSNFKALFKSSTVPKCTGHDEVCVTRTVLKSGPNEGRSYTERFYAISSLYVVSWKKQPTIDVAESTFQTFYCCARPPGTTSNREARCSFFKWDDRSKPFAKPKTPSD